MSEDAEQEDYAPLRGREDPYLDENGELPIEEVHHRQKVDAAMGAVQVAGPFVIIPVALIFLLASLVLGDWVWDFLIVLPVAFMAAIFAVPIIARMRQKGDLKVLDFGVLKGREKRTALLMALALMVIAVILAMYGGIWEAEAARWLRGVFAGEG